MTDLRSHHDLKVWCLGMEIVENIYTFTKQFPREELYGLTSQLRRAATSIPANIAEGNGRDSIRQYLHHLSIAVGSLCEVETLLHIAIRLKYIDRNHTQNLFSQIEEEGRMLRGLQKSLRSKINQKATL
ncbi:MAG: four helix bundle protein [Pirellulales bacterium]|nr:four helix bundle protein [Pirellulales bacterium]